jgi:hypothetical protein
MLEGDPGWKYTYQRFAIPVKEAVKPTNDFDPAIHEYFDETEASYGFENYVFYWTGSTWTTCKWLECAPFKGYQLANNSKNGGVVYTFTGNLVGNETGDIFPFESHGFDYFGNSYTAPIHVQTLLEGFGSNMQATVWLYNYGTKNWQQVALADFEDGLVDDEFMQIKSMDGFLLYLNSGSGSASISYADAIWGNPLLGGGSTPAPARQMSTDITNCAVITVMDNSGMGDNLTLVEKENRSAEFENGADAPKFIAEEGICIYAETAIGQLGRVATNDLSNTLISFRSGNSTEYTLSFSKVQGDAYIVRDNVTNQTFAMAADVEYTFTQAANTTIPARFEIVGKANVPTAIDNVEGAAKTIGIYSVTGQFLGHDFTSLPAGVYIVNGVKIVK